MTVDVGAQLRKGVVEYCILGLLATEPTYGWKLSEALVSRGLIASIGTLYASEPIQINKLILDSYCARKSLRKPLTALRALTQPMEGSLTPQSFYFVFGSEKIGLCVLTNVKIVTSKWLGGEPSYAIVDLTLLKIPDPDSAPKPMSYVSSSNLYSLTNRQKIDASKNATAWLQTNKSKIPSNIRKIISVNSYKLLTTDTGVISMLDPKNNVLGIIGSWNGKVFDPSTQTLIN